VQPAGPITNLADLADVWRVSHQEQRAAAGGDLGALTACTTCRSPMFAVASRCGFCLWDVWSQAGG